MFANRRFRFSLEFTLIGLVLASVCFGMGYWQYQRYANKKVYFDTVHAREAEGRHPFDPNQQDWSISHHALVGLTGSFENEQEVVLINRSMDGQPGVKVVTPFRLAGSEQRILIDRGYLPYAMYMSGKVEDWRHEGEVAIEGVVRPSAGKSFALAPSMPAPKPGEWKARWLRLEVDIMASQLPYSLLPVYLEQTSPLGTWPVHDPREVLHPARHLNYAIQWPCFGTLVMLFFMFLQFPKRKAPS